MGRGFRLEDSVKRGLLTFSISLVKKKQEDTFLQVGSLHGYPGGMVPAGMQGSSAHASGTPVIKEF